MKLNLNCSLENSEEFVKENVDLIIKFAKRLYSQNMSAGKAGNISVRSDNNCLITTSGSDMSMLKEEDIVCVDLTNHVKSRNGRVPSSELPVHRSIYAERNDVNAIVHCHPCYINAIGIARIELNASVMPEAYIQLEKIATVEYKLPGSKELAKAVQEKSVESNVLMLLNHGAITLGKDIKEAFYRMELFESYAKTVFLARQIGTIQGLTHDQIQELNEFKKKKGL